jgi:hemoglobin/transferrin/lactoferrin receptor protein
MSGLIFAQSDVYARYQVTENFGLNLAVQNLLDIAFFSHGSVADYSHIEDYEGVRGFQAPGRDIRLIAS